MSLNRRARRSRQRGAASGEKMSEILTDVALPLLQEVPDGDDKGYEIALRMAALMWNASRVQDEQVRKKAITELVNLAGAPDSAGIEALCRDVIDRAARRYPRVQRMIGGVEVVPLSQGRYTVRVSSME